MRLRAAFRLRAHSAPRSLSNQEWRCLPPSKASSACATTVASDARKRGRGSGMLEGRCPDVPDLSDRFPTLLRPLRFCGETAELEGGDTHRPKLPVWASCRMRCSCLFIILGPDLGPRGHRGGSRLATPGPACFSARFAPDGWAALWLPGPPRFSGWRWRWRWRSPPPLTTPPPAPRSLLSPSLESRFLAAFGPQRPPAGRLASVCRSVSLQYAG